MSKIVVYTAIFNNYDWLKEPVIKPKDIDFICYTDSDAIQSKNWKVVKMNLDGKNPSLLNREIKLLYPYTKLQDYDYSLYVDGSMMIKGNVGEFIRKYIQSPLVLVNFRHPNKDCLFAEIDYCIERRRGNVDKLKEQRVIYEEEGMPKHFGLSDNKILLRDNHSEEGEKMMKEWFEHVVDYSGRDQVCLPYVLYKYHKEYVFFEENIENNEYFETWPHNVDAWYIRNWRKFKWFCERHHVLMGLVTFLDKNIKPILLGK